MGHLLTFYPDDPTRGKFPKWDFTWVLRSRVEKKSDYVKTYHDCIKYLSTINNFEKVIIATDYDTEGTVIGFITLLSVINSEELIPKLFRMKMNSLDKTEVQRAYNDLQPPDYTWFNAGIARHEIDALFGINLTEVFTSAVCEERGRRRMVTFGRVQSHALKFIVDREKEIVNFKSEPYWLVEMELIINNEKYIFKHQHGEFRDYQEVTKVIADSKNAIKAVATQIEEKTEFISPPHLFSQETLQQEAYYKLHFNPSLTDQIAQSLYQNSLISYPRSGSTSIHTGVPYTKILPELQKESVYTEYVTEIITKNYIPTSGGIVDSAHSAIFPTGNLSQPRYEKEQQLLDLIKRRFIATFLPSAIRNRIKTVFAANNQPYELTGYKTENSGWTKAYPYIKYEETQIPTVKEGQTADINRVYNKELKTKPQRRYQYASLIKEMENNGIGTKATRSNISKGLWSRGYINYVVGEGLVPTKLGVAVIDVATQFTPQIVNVSMTAQLERDLEKIMSGELDRAYVTGKAKKEIEDIIKIVTETNNFKYIGKTINDIL